MKRRGWVIDDLPYTPEELFAFVTIASPVSAFVPYLPFNKLGW